MAKFELKLPKMGESVAEATLTTWLKEVGDTIELDEPVLEIATDKVDSEVPSEVEGVLIEQLFNVDDVVQVGQTIAIIETEALGAEAASTDSGADANETTAEVPVAKEIVKEVEKPLTDAATTGAAIESTSERFYSPLVKSMAATEGVSQQEL